MPPLWISCSLSRTTIERSREGLRTARGEKKRKERKTGEEFKVYENFSSRSVALIRTERFSSIRIKINSGTKRKTVSIVQVHKHPWEPRIRPSRTLLGGAPGSEALVCRTVSALRTTDRSICGQDFCYTSPRSLPLCSRDMNCYASVPSLSGTTGRTCFQIVIG